MDRSGEHQVARIDDTVIPANQRAAAVAVPDSHHLEQRMEAVATGRTGRHPQGASPDGPAGAVQP